MKTWREIGMAHIINRAEAHTIKSNETKEIFKKALWKLFKSGITPSAINNDTLATMLEISPNKLSDKELQTKIQIKMKALFSNVTNTKEIIEFQYKLYLESIQKPEVL
jgi:hypothetical protein